VLGEVDALTGEADSLGQQPLPLFGVEVLGQRSVRAHHPVPRHRPVVEGQHPADDAGRAGADVVGDVPVGHHPAGRDRLDAGQDALREVGLIGLIGLIGVGLGVGVGMRSWGHGLRIVCRGDECHGTRIGAQVVGRGPSVVLVHGSTADHTRWAPLVPLLRDDFTLVMVDRRGRGRSTHEAADYAIEREGEDILALLDAVPAPALVFGHSYGASAMLAVLHRLTGCRALLLYEPPFAMPGHEVFTDDQLARWDATLAEGRREELLELFYREALRFDTAAIDAVRLLPMWKARVAAVHTVVREADVVRRFVPPVAPAPVPVRILLGDATTPHLTASTRAAAGAVTGSELAILPGQGHVAIDAAPDLIARHVRETWDLGR
jgi:pimeloyl-ACP methyl ester carboxylesterase